MSEQAQIIEAAFEERQQLNPETASPKLVEVIVDVIDALDRGVLRIAEKQNDNWIVHQWLKKAVLLYFTTFANQVHSINITNFFDKVPLKFADYSAERFTEESVRVVPPAYVRKGAFVGEHTVLMPSYVNIGAYIDSGCMIDTWATIGSCAQIGKNVHISGGAGIGGVLEPLQANPTIIEDNVFIGARSEIVEGVIVGEDSVISMGVFLGQSTKIYNRLTNETTYGRIPAGSVVVPGSLPAPDGSHNINCAIIVKQVDHQTRSKVGINELLRGY